MPAAASVLLSSLVLGLAHVAPAAIVYTFFAAGLSFALVTRWHRSLWAGVILHICNNVLVQIIVMVGI
ncbi:CPBP family glutamic-type intramembrane protease [Corynebacterium riegelii]|uniref:CPBP family glutamic-type intramembrane protease n=1 Tax=Corynebacterium riegelii TaxID=156976 RepID=UPI00191D57F1|nr:CPBP family glutamic-type intramembrane protease [Corynebacterium riegelii]QQU83445.1 CPBP family intramembrane metalloprotease [Corynebacterium riegelii]